jgi:PiT family inorganic phosphate transporter
MLELLILVVVAALIFDFINGFHDAANAIATSVSTGVMSVRTAVVVSGIFNFVGALAGTAVAAFIAKGIADPANVTQLVVLAALIGASAWNLLTWWWGIPSSSSHALVGGLCGAVVASKGFDFVHWQGVVGKVAIPLVLSPLIGFLTAFILMVVSLWLVRHLRPNTVATGARGLQLVSACTLSFSHGMNDAQKVMGVITMALIAFMASHQVQPLVTNPANPTAAHQIETLSATEAEAASVAHARAVAGSSLPDVVKEHHQHLLPTAHLNSAGETITDVPLWVVLSCALAMCLGTMAGGKRIIKTMGTKIIRISPLQGFAAQASGTATIIAASMAGIPVSTTHCITASVMGAGISKGLAAVRWGMAINILIAWVLTLPASALVAWLSLLALEGAFGR